MPFRAALLGAANKLNEYYEKMAESDAHILTMRMSDVLIVTFSC